MRKFTKFEIAAIKRNAQNVAQFVTKKAKIDAKIKELEAEKAALQPLIDSFQGPIKAMTGGYTTEDLIVRTPVKTGKMDAKTGKEIIQWRYDLKYPETVVPPTSDDEVKVLGTREPMSQAEETAEYISQNEDEYAEAVPAPSESDFDWNA